VLQGVLVIMGRLYLVYCSWILEASPGCPGPGGQAIPAVLFLETRGCSRVSWSWWAGYTCCIVLGDEGLL
jgi:hypothetical protein